jgi:hypothetical protein
MEWFEKRARELQQKEIESLHREIADRETAYFDEIRKAGFDNMHDYENWVMGKFMKRVVICGLIVIVFIVWWLI